MRLAITMALMLVLAACGKTAAQKQQEDAATLTTLGEKYVKEKSWSRTRPSSATSSSARAAHGSCAHGIPKKTVSGSSPRISEK